MSQGTNTPTTAPVISITPAPPTVSTNFRWTITHLMIPAGEGFQLTLRGCWRADQVSSATAKGYLASKPFARPVMGQVSVSSGQVIIAFGAFGTGPTQVDLTITIDVAFTEPLASAAAGTLLDIRVQQTFRVPMVLGAAGPVGAPPPDPGTLAPPLDRSVTTDLLRLTSFLYTGSNRVQCGVVPGTIVAQRICLLRGRITTHGTTSALQPLPGVAVTIHEQVGYGATVSRADGTFDLVVNGGRPLDLVFEKAGYLPVRRQIQPRWRETRQLADIVMVTQDTSPTTKLDTSVLQVARGAEVEDAHGKRQATLIVPAGIEATMVLPNGTSTKLTSFHVRALEYTVGPNGPQAMPADLPPTSGYTYCVEYSMDEAVCFCQSES